MPDPISALAATPFGAIREVAETFHDIAKDLARAKEARRERIAVLFDQIGQTIRDVVVELRAERVPHGNCEKMRVYAQRLPDVVGRHAGRGVADDLAKRLFEVHEVELLLFELGRVPDRAAALGALEAAAGLFDASADLVRVR